MARNPYRRYEVTEYQKEALKFLQPPEDITVSEWADKYRVLDAKTSAMPGPWRTEHTPYLKGIMDEFNNYETEEIVYVKPTQVGGTECLQNMVGYIVQQDPAPTMIVYPTDTLAKSISENRLQPMFKAAPELRKRFDENSQLQELQFDLSESQKRNAENNVRRLSDRLMGGSNAKQTVSRWQVHRTGRHRKKVDTLRN